MAVAPPLNTNIRFPQSEFLDPVTKRPAREWVIFLQNPQVVTQTINYIIVNGGQINDTVIGNLVPSTGVFTDLTALNGIGGGKF